MAGPQAVSEPQALVFPWPEPPAFGQVADIANGLLWFRLPLPYRLDQVIAKISPNIGVYAMEPEANALGDYLRSLHALGAELPADVLVLPGHGLPFEGLHARAQALMQHQEGRCALIHTACEHEGQTAASLVPVVFARVLDARQTGFAFVEVLAHVNYMAARGQLRRSRQGGQDRYRSVGSWDRGLHDPIRPVGPNHTPEGATYDGQLRSC